MRNGLLNYFPGILLCTVITACAYFVSQIPTIQTWGLSALTCALLFGILLGNILAIIHHPTFAKGLLLSKQRLLRLGVVLFGFNITIQELIGMGLTGVLISVAILASVMYFSIVLGKRIGLDSSQSVLIGAGAAICGAAAVIATASVLRSDTNKVTIAIATVVLFGTMSIFLYPLLASYLHEVFHFSPHMLGLYIGGSVHEVAQVVAAAHPLGLAVESSAVITKMMRVLLLFPFLLIVAQYFHSPSDNTASPASFPWFAVAFILMIGLHSTDWLTAEMVHILRVLGTLSLTMAMAALGISTQFAALRTAGSKPILLALILYIWLLVAGAILAYIAGSML